MRTNTLLDQSHGTFSSAQNIAFLALCQYGLDSHPSSFSPSTAFSSCRAGLLSTCPTHTSRAMAWRRFQHPTTPPSSSIHPQLPQTYRLLHRYAPSHRSFRACRSIPLPITRHRTQPKTLYSTWRLSNVSSFAFGYAHLNSSKG